MSQDTPPNATENTTPEAVTASPPPPRKYSMTLMTTTRDDNETKPVAPFSRHDLLRQHLEAVEERMEESSSWCCIRF